MPDTKDVVYRATVTSVVGAVVPATTKGLKILFSCQKMNHPAS